MASVISALPLPDKPNASLCAQTNERQPARFARASERARARRLCAEAINLFALPIRLVN
ncbi:MAG: hypothetical protein H0V88_14615 [Pyrinomonadaceae bacterium]|nr:hypothetical protein [Pyrinomonadaceae bacterium]